MKFRKLRVPHGGISPPPTSANADLGKFAYTRLLLLFVKVTNVQVLVVHAHTKRSDEVVLGKIDKAEDRAVFAVQEEEFCSL